MLVIIWKKYSSLLTSGDLKEETSQLQKLQLISGITQIGTTAKGKLKSFFLVVLIGMRICFIYIPSKNIFPDCEAVIVCMCLCVCLCALARVCVEGYFKPLRLVVVVSC
jgi:hypothetical protein